MSQRLKRLFPYLKVAYIVCVVAMIAWALRDLDFAWSRVPGLMFWAQSWAVIGAWIAMVYLLGALWALWLRWRERLALHVLEWLPLQSMAWSGRYLPGKIGLLAGKLSLAQSHGLRMRAVTLSVVVEQLGFLVAGTCIGLSLFQPGQLVGWAWMHGWVSRHWAWLMPVVVLVGIAAFPFAVRIAARVLSDGDAVKPKGNGHPLVLVLLYALPHLLIGVAFYALVVEMFPQAASLPATHVIALLALAHVAGILAVFAPAGLGVREVVLAGGLSSALAFDEALLLATMLRMLTTLADALVFLMGAGLIALRKVRH